MNTTKNNINIKVGKVAYNNCMFWALYHWFKYGGYLVLRRAKSFIPYPHFMWIPHEGSKPYHFVPVRRLQLPWPIFRGFVKEGDWTKKELQDLKDGQYR